MVPLAMELRPPAAPAAADPPRVPWRGLWLVAAAALVVRYAFLLLEPATHPVADERTWVNWALENLLSEKVGLNPLRTRMIFYPPAYPYFIALPYLAFGTLAAVKWLQATLAALLVPAIGGVGARAFGAKAGLVAGGLVAVYPELVWFSVHFWSETLFMVFLWWAFERLLAADAGGGARPGVAAGLLWGAAILTRETALYFTPLAALWLAWRAPRPGGLRRATAFVLAATLVVVPWTWRNWVVFHAFVPVSTAGGLNLYQGNARLTRQQVYDRYDAVQGRIEQYRFARQAGIEAVLERQPFWVFEKLRDEMPKFWEADSLALIHVKRGAYGSVEPTRAALAAVVVLAPYLLLLGLFVAGLSALPWDRRRLLLVGYLVFHNALHVASHGFARYRLPALPVVILVAAWALAAWRDGSYPRLTRPRRVLAAALALGFAVTLVPSLRENWRHEAFGLGRDAGGPLTSEP